MNHDISNVGVTPHFSTGQYLLENIFRKDKYLLTQSIEKSFLIDTLTTNNAIYYDTLALLLVLGKQWVKIPWQFHLIQYPVGHILLVSLVLVVRLVT